MILGMEIIRDRKHRKLLLTQERYSQKVLERFGMLEVRPMSTPMQEPLDPKNRLEVEANDFCNKSVPYFEAIGSLMYLMVGTRPDIAFANGKLSKFCERPERKHWNAVKLVLRYMSGSKSLSICFGSDPDIVPHVYTEADWGGNVKNRTSTSDCLFFMGGGAISSALRKQTIVAASTCEAQ